MNNQAKHIERSQVRATLRELGKRKADNFRIVGTFVGRQGDARKAWVRKP